MAQPFALGARAVSICDRCGFKFLLSTLEREYVRGHDRGVLVCKSCFDDDHPQNWQGAQPVDDPQALRDPRPDQPEPAADPYVPPPIYP
jgi:hypothetical protein